MPRHAVIINPRAAKGAGRDYARRIEEYLAGRGESCTVYYSLTEGDPERLAGEAARCHERVWAVGGDGTVNEVARGIYGSGAALAVIPLGTGNDFIKTAGIPADFDGAVRNAVEGARSRIDLGRFAGRLFVNVAGLGFDADTAAGVGKFAKLGLTGLGAYIPSLFSTLLTLRNRPMEIVLDGRELRYRAIMVDCGNGGYIGGGIRICPEADLADGLLDVCVVHDVPGPLAPFLLGRVVNGTHGGLKYVDFFRAKRISIRLGEEVNIQIDGQIFRGDSVEAEVIESALDVILPATTGR